MVGGRIKIIALNNYIPFEPGCPQYAWAVQEFKGVDRSTTPWLFVMVHGAIYHTYATHYKELDCFR